MSDLQRVGPVFGGTGTAPPFTADITGAQRVATAHGLYYDPTSRRTVYSGAIVGQVTTVGLSATYTGLCLSNPNGSSVNLVLNKVGCAFIVAFGAGAVIGLMAGYSATNVTQTTPVTPRCQFITGAGGGAGLLASSATLQGTPILNTIFASGLTGAITTAPHVPGGLYEMDGSIILPPGAWVAIYTSTASGTAAGAFSMQWEELPVLV